MLNMEKNALTSIDSRRAAAGLINNVTDARPIAAPKTYGNAESIILRAKYLLWPGGIGTGIRMRTHTIISAASGCARARCACIVRFRLRAKHNFCSRTFSNFRVHLFSRHSAYFVQPTRYTRAPSVCCTHTRGVLPSRSGAPWWRILSLTPVLAHECVYINCVRVSTPAAPAVCPQS